MAIDSNRQVDEAGIDQITANQRTRAYRKGTTYGDVSDSNATPLGVLIMNGTMVPTSFASGSQTYTAAILGSGIIIHKNAGAANGTLDTATAIINYMNNNSSGVQVGDILQCLVCNTGTSTLTIVPDASGALDTNGSGAIPTLTSRLMNIRITNITTPAYIVYL